MKTRLLLGVPAVLTLVTLVGCGAQGVLLGTDAGYLLRTQDAITPPGQEVTLYARLQAGDLLEDQPGHIVWFMRGGQLYKAAETDGQGVAVASFTPDKPGDYEFTVQVSPTGFPDLVPEPMETVVVCRPADTPIVVVDLDHTVVDAGFSTVLLGDPPPMADSVEVLGNLSKDHAIVFLTHRPSHFGPKSKLWLLSHKYPPAPLLLSDIGGVLEGSGAFKTKRIALLREKFPNIRIGIGDKISDAQAYFDNGLQAFLILPLPKKPTAPDLRMWADRLELLDERVQVVLTWKQIAQVLAGQGDYPRSAMQKTLRERADQMEPPEPTSGTTAAAN